MTYEFRFLLIPLIALALVGLATRARLGWTWGWSFVVQFGAILLCGGLGFIAGPAWLYCLFGYFLLFIFMVMPHRLVSQLEASLSVLDFDKAAEQAEKLTYFYWGKSGIFFVETVETFRMLVEGEVAKADAMLEMAQADAPRPIREQIGRYRVLGRILLNDWQGLIDALEAGKLSAPRGNSLISIARAYAELGKIERATECFQEAQLIESRAGVRSLALTLLPYFALAGEKERTEKLLSILVVGPKALPTHAVQYWRARQELSAGAIDQANITLKEALRHAESAAIASGAWKKRIEQFIKKIESGEVKAEKRDWSLQTDKIWKLFEQGCFVESIIQPDKHVPIVGLLCLIIALSFAVSSVYSYVRTEAATTLSTTILAAGYLDPRKVLAGQYWRLFTHLFLHKDAVHLVVNLIGLYWFGRIAYNIFGAARFFFIFLVSGMLSGIAQALMAPDSIAIGASGGVMGILGAVAAGIFRLKDYLPDRIRKIELYWLAGLALSSVISDKFSPWVAGYAHFGGMLAGLAFGFIVRLPKPTYDFKEAQLQPREVIDPDTAESS